MADYLIKFTYTDDIEPEARYITAEFMDSEEEAIAWAKKRLGDTVVILEVEDVTDTRR